MRFHDQFPRSICPSTLSGQKVLILAACASIPDAEIETKSTEEMLELATHEPAASITRQYEKKSQQVILVKSSARRCRAMKPAQLTALKHKSLFV